MKNHASMFVPALLVIAGISLLPLGGCNTVNSTEHANAVAPRHMIRDKRIVTDLGLDDSARVVGVNQATTADGFLKVQVELLNTTPSPCDFRYSFEWFDAQGMLLSTATPSWIPDEIQGGESKFIVGLAPTPTARDFRFKLIKN